MQISFEGGGEAEVELRPLELVVVVVISCAAVGSINYNNANGTSVNSKYRKREKPISLFKLILISFITADVYKAIEVPINKKHRSVYYLDSFNLPYAEVFKIQYHIICSEHYHRTRFCYY